jgi:hypothetical protein
MGLDFINLAISGTSSSRRDPKRPGCFVPAPMRDRLTDEDHAAMDIKDQLSKVRAADTVKDDAVRALS